MRLAGRYILTTNEYKVLFKCKRIIEKKISEEGIDYYISVHIYRHSDKYFDREGYNEGKDTKVYLFADKNDKPLDWIFLTKDEFLVELL